MREGRLRPRQPSGSTRGRFSVMPPARDMRKSFREPELEEWSHEGQVTSVRRQEVRRQPRRPTRSQRCRAGGPCHRRKPAWRESSRWCGGRPTATRSGHRRARWLPPFHDLLSIHCADDEASEVVLSISIEPGHLSRLSTDERTAVLTACPARHTADNLLGDERREPAGRKIVQKKQTAPRLGRGCR